MTRKEEIVAAAESGYFVTKAEKFAWIHGAEWADDYPRKGLWDAEKVIEWLRNNQHGFILTDIDIEDLRKAMED